MSSVARITEFYRTYLGREPDAGGLANYEAQARKGRKLSSIKKEIATSKEARDNVVRAQQYRTAASEYANQASNYESQLQGLTSQIESYKDRVRDFDARISNYQSQVEGLTGQYNQALQTAQQNAAERDKYLNQFTEATEKYEAAQAEADRYREEAVGNQLRAVRSGATAGGANQTSQMRGNLASGKTGYSSEDSSVSDLAESLKGQGGLTDSVLNREGGVVEQLNRGASNTNPGGAQRRSNVAGSGSYYASRFA